MSNAILSQDPFRDPILRAYLDHILEWHGYVRALGLPTMKDNPSVPISQLYVAPGLSTTQISPDSKELPEGEHILQVLEIHRRLVVQGDPGSGKSTLVNWLAWRLAAGLSAPLPEFLQNSIPIPLILRELNPDSMESFDKLLASFMKRPVAAALNNDPAPLIKALKTGKALILVDGLDELPEHQRKQLINCLRKAFVIYKKAIWLITSRVVGFDENLLQLEHTDDLTGEETIKHRFLSEGVPAAFLSLIKGNDLSNVVTTAIKPVAIELGNQLLNELSQPQKGISSGETLTRALLAHGLNDVLPDNEKRPWRKLHRVYVMPFDDKRIENFSRAWYQVRGSAAQESANCENFLQSVRANHATHTLARNPQILTLMALVFRTRLDLPQGRALLYEYITQAYLESIDQAYGILDARFTWQEKKRLLGRVGFEMQYRRVTEYIAEKNKTRRVIKDESTASHGILFSETEVKNWIVEALSESRSDADDELALAFLDHISRRSGLLLPRGEGIYAFVHLTFQEYFAALYLREEICSPEFIEDKIAVDKRISQESLRDWSGETLWHETLLFMHELVGNNPRWAKRIASWVFGSNVEISEKSPKEDWNRLSLQILIADDIHTGLDKETCTSVFQRACEGLKKVEDITFYFDEKSQKIVSFLCKSSYGTELLLESLEKRKRIGISLNDCKENFEKIVNSKTISENTILLTLKNNNITNIDFISNGYTALSSLDIDEPLLENINGISHCRNLITVRLNCPKLKDISPLLKCQSVKLIGLKNSNISDLSEFIKQKRITILGDFSKVPTDQHAILIKRAKKFAEKNSKIISNKPSAPYRINVRGAEATRPPKKIN